MTLLAPLWLLLLVPWAALWAWRRRGGDSARVPFLPLWPAATTASGPRRRRPPLWAVLLLLAAGLAIVAAASPARVVPVKALTVVIDSGPALTPARLRQAMAGIPINPTTRVRVVPSVGTASEQVGGIDLSPLTRSAFANDDALRSAVRRSGGAVVVADHELTGLPAGTPVVTPFAPLVNAGIDRFAVVVVGRNAQAMVRVVNFTERTRARLQIDQITQAVDLPPFGTARDYFVDLPMPGDAVRATLLDEHGGRFADDFTADDHAYVTLTNPPARVEPHGPLPTAVARVIAVYAAHRPAGAGGGVVTVGATLTDGPGVRLAESFAAPTTRPATPAAGRVLAIDTAHPVTRTADLRELLAAPRVGGGPTDDGRGPWRTLVRDGDDVLLAVRESPARQAWVGVDTAALADTPAFVVLWADLLDWLGGGATAWANGPFRDGLKPLEVADASLAGGPGVYRDGDRTVAVFTPAVRPGGVSTAAALPLAITMGTVSVSSWALLGALVLMVAGLGVARWGNAHFRSRLTVGN